MRVVGKRVLTISDEGTGKGLDADTLDGQQHSHFLDYNNFTNTPTIPAGNQIIDWTASGAGTIHSSNYTDTTYSVGDGGLTEKNFTSTLKTKLDGIAAGAEVNVQSDWNASSGDAQILNKPTIPTNNNQLTNGAGYVTTSGWTSSNDGSGSGLDADTLDGLNLHTGRNNEANKVVRTDGNGYLQTGWINTISGDSGVGNDVSRIYCSHDGYLRYLNKQHFKVLVGLTGKTTYDRRDYTSDSNYWTGVMSHGNENFDTTFYKGSGFTDNWSNPANQPSGTSHWNGVQCLHYSAGAMSNTYGWQMVVGAGNPSLCYLRGSWGGTNYSWYKMWNAYNDGSGSGLDADTCDGQHLGTGANVTFNYIHLDGVLSGITGGGSWIGRNYAYNTVELLGYGAEFMIGAQSGAIHINYRYCNGSSSYTPGTWYWRAGTSSNWSNHNFGSVTSNGNVYATGNVTAYSDIRLKENIRPIQNALDVVSKLEGVHYTRKETGEEEIGFIAQDVKEVFPELVEIVDSRVEDPHEGLQDGIEDLHVMKYQNAVALLVEAIKEQQAQIDDIKQTIN